VGLSYFLFLQKKKSWLTKENLLNLFLVEYFFMVFILEEFFMKYIKIYFLIVFSIFLSGCIQSTALLGPGVTIATTGNIMQAGFQYGANTAIKNETGKDVLTHFKDVVEEEQDNKKLELKIKDIATITIEKVKKKLLIN
jgi:hypothetical protein